MLAGKVNRERTIPRSLSGCNEGTPNIYSVSLTPDIDHSIIDVGFHYQRNCDVDRQARGRLTNFTTWTAAPDPGADDLLIAAVAAQGRAVNGNIGDRDTAVFDNTRYTLHEAQYVEPISVSDRREPALRRSVGRPGCAIGGHAVLRHWDRIVAKVRSREGKTRWRSPSTNNASSMK